MAVLTSLGVKIVIGSSTDKTNKPAAWKKIPQVIEMSELDLDPDTIDTTSFDDTKYKTSIPGLVDTSGIQTITVNATSEATAETAWNDAAKLTNAYVWLCVIIPNQTKATYIPIIPMATGAYNVAVNDRITLRLRFTIRADLEFAAAPDANIIT